MYSAGGKTFYIEEVAQLNDKRIVIPKRWIIRNKELCADCVTVTPPAVGDVHHYLVRLIWIELTVFTGSMVYWVDN